MKVGSVRFETEDDADVTAYLQGMSHPRRRRTLEILSSQDCSMELMELTQRIRAATEDKDRNDRESIRLSLYHRHLPKLDETGLVEFDYVAGTVALTKEAENHLDKAD